MENKVCVVTGALYEGLGAAICIELSKAGHHVAVLHRKTTSRSESEIKKTTRLLKKAVESHGVQFQTIRGNVAEEVFVKKVIDKLYKQYGRIDVLVNCDGGRAYPLKHMENFDKNDWNSAIDREIKGPLTLIQNFLPVMRANKYGRIINITYDEHYWNNNLPLKQGTLSTNNAWPFITTKAMKSCISDSLAISEEGFGITMNTLRPGTIKNLKINDMKTHSFQSQERATSVEFAKVVSFLCSDIGGVVTGSQISIRTNPYRYTIKDNNQ